MKKYQPTEIEPKWQQKWRDEKLHQTDLSDPKNKYYLLVELPYTSGALHIGHWFTFSKGDILARFKRMQGYNVIYPNGYDTFGLPAENAAIRNKMHPKEWTEANITKMRQQFEAMGTVIDWEKSAVTCDPGYYKWNQWIFLKMLERGIAYKGKALSNWCPSCQTVLADENVEAGKCWRCGTEVAKKEVDQWFLKITEYADRLIWQDPPQADWPKALRVAQNNWIGKSVGVLIKFDNFEVFTTRPDTIYGATAIIISPEHPLIENITHESEKENVQQYIQSSAKKTDVERKEGKDKSGVFTGGYVTNPLSQEKIPVWVADYVLMGYGTGAIMAVPAHDQRDYEFAKQFDLPIKTVIQPADSAETVEIYEDEGVLVDSGEYTGMDSAQAREKIASDLVKQGLGQPKVNYHLHDWSISRQRYWGTPIPIIYCDDCGTVPVPYEDLPVVLPEKVDYTPNGLAPLGNAKEWVEVNCPKCGKPAKREVETMDGFIDNSWYFYRYLDPNNSQEIFDKKLIADWMPIDIYIGGAEHTFGHALYSRFFSEFFKDIGLVEFGEYTKKRLHHGVILGPDGHRMSKSRGNVVDPDQETVKFGADAVRVYLNFLGPYDIVAPWNPSTLQGNYHFLERVWNLFDAVTADESGELSDADSRFLNKTVSKVTKDIEEMKFNTAVAALMEWLNHLAKQKSVEKRQFKVFLILLSPFAPHITEELWEMLGEKFSIHQQSWPKAEELSTEKEVNIVVQVNGKVRDNIMITSEILNSDSDVEKQALESPKVQAFIKEKQITKVIYVPGKVLNIVAN